MKAILKNGEIIDIIKNEDFSAARYINKETTEYVFDDEIEAVINDDISFDAIYKIGFEAAIDKAAEWIKTRVNIDMPVETNEDGEPLAESYLEYATERLRVAEEIAEEFKKEMLEDYV